MSPEQRAAGAKQSFEHTVSEFHLPSAEADGEARDELLAQAAEGYRQVLRRYGDQAYWCAQATRSLGNVRAEQGRLDDAIRLYERVGDRYAGYEWEVLQAWKSAGDLLWEAGRVEDARVFYRRIVERFDGNGDDQPPVYRTIVKAAKGRV
jgi:tetratricopeptide (TPR) repeat protein